MSLPDRQHPLSGRLRLNNIAVAVGNLASMVAWYQKVLGFTVAERGRFTELDAEYAMLEGAGVRLELVSRPGAAQQGMSRKTVSEAYARLTYDQLLVGQIEVGSFVHAPPTRHARKARSDELAGAAGSGSGQGCRRRCSMQCRKDVPVTNTWAAQARCPFLWTNGAAACCIGIRACAQARNTE
jgi:catechol 2,3-dioxygenase-like lactoylglutathione lyase family enzyme